MSDAEIKICYKDYTLHSCGSWWTQWQVVASASGGDLKSLRVSSSDNQEGMQHLKWGKQHKLEAWETPEPMSMGQKPWLSLTTSKLDNAGGLQKLAPSPWNCKHSKLAAQRIWRRLCGS